MAEVKLTIVGEDKSGPARQGLLDTEKAIGLVKAAAVALGVSLSAMTLVKYGEDAAIMAARYNTLGVTMTKVGANALYTASQMREFSESLQKNGIAMVESRQTLTQMAQAHVDLSKAQALGRIAQDAAVIGNMNSSEAFQHMIYGIQSGQVEILRTIGINVNFEQSYAKLGKQLGKTAEELSETEKAQARTNAVMEKGKDISGTYEAAMGTAGKQIASLKRYFDDLKVVAGEAFQPLLSSGVGILTNTLKAISTHIEGITTAIDLFVGTGITIYFARLTETVVTAVVAQNNYMRAVAEGNVVTLGSAEANLQKAAALEAEAAATAAAAIAEEAYWKAELQSAVALKEKLVIEAQSIPVGVSRASNAQRIAIANMEVKATEIMLAESTAVSSAAQARATAATGALITAKTGASIGGRVLTGVTSGLNTAMTLLGGPIGLITIAITAATYAWVKYGEAAQVAQAKAARMSVDRPTSKLALQNEEMERAIKAARQTPGEKETESNNRLAIQMEGFQKEKAELQRKIALERNKTTFLGFGGPDKKAIADMEYQLKLVERDIEYVPRLTAENKKFTAELDKIRAAKNNPEDPDKAEKEYLANIKNSIEGVKNYAAAMKDLGKERLAFAGEKYSDNLKRDVELYKEGKKAAEDLITPLKRYNVEINGVYNERLSSEKSGLDKIAALYDDFKKKIKVNSQSKEAKAAGVEILKAYRDTAQGIIAVEQDRYKTLYEGERKLYEQFKTLNDAKKAELRELKQSIEESNKAVEENRRTALGDFSGGYDYLDPNLDALAKRQAMLDKLRQDEAAANAVEDPATKQKKLLAVADAYLKITDAVDLNGQTVITKEQAWQSALENRNRIQKQVVSTAEAEQQKLESLYQKTLDKMETYKSKLLDLDNILRSLTSTITIDLKVNGMEQINKIQGFVNSAVSSPFSSSTTVSTSTVSGFQSGGNAWDYYQVGDSFYWGDGTYGGPAYEKGGRVAETGLALVHKNEEITPAGSTASPQTQPAGDTYHFHGDMVLPNVTNQSTARELFTEFQKLARRQASK